MASLIFLVTLHTAHFQVHLSGLDSSERLKKFTETQNNKNNQNLSICNLEREGLNETTKNKI